MKETKTTKYALFVIAVALIIIIAWLFMLSDGLLQTNDIVTLNAMNLNLVERMDVRLNNVFQGVSFLWQEHYEMEDEDWLKVECKEDRIFSEDEIKVWKINEDYIQINVLVDDIKYKVYYWKNGDILCAHNGDGIDCKDILCEETEELVQNEDGSFTLDIVDDTLDITKVQDKIK